jgi:hypothetical protein
LAGFTGGVGAGAGFGLLGLTPGLTIASRAALRAAIIKSNSIFAAPLADFFSFAVVAAVTTATVRSLNASASVLNLEAPFTPENVVRNKS